MLRANIEVNMMMPLMMLRPSYLFVWLVLGAAQPLRTESVQLNTDRHCILLPALTVHNLQEEEYL